MAIKIQAEEKKYPRDPGYNTASSNDFLNLSDFDKWAIEARIKQENRRWIFGQVFKWVVAILVGIFFFKAMAG